MKTSKYTQVKLLVSLLISMIYTNLVDAQIFGNPHNLNNVSEIVKIENWSGQCEFDEELENNRNLELKSIDYYDSGKYIRTENYGPSEKISSVLINEYKGDSLNVFYRLDSYENRYEKNHIRRNVTRSIKYSDGSPVFYTEYRYDTLMNLISFKDYKLSGEFKGGEIYRYDENNRKIYSQLFDSQKVYFVNLYLYDSEGELDRQLRFDSTNMLISKIEYERMDNNSFRENHEDLKNNETYQIEKIEELDEYGNLKKSIIRNSQSGKCKIYLKIISYN